MKETYILAKITTQEFAESFLDGNIFMRKLSQFGVDNLVKQNPEMNEKIRGDYLEGLGAVNFDSKQENISFGELNSIYLDENILSLYALKYDGENYNRPNIKLKEFGKGNNCCVVLIYKPKEFIKRIMDALSKSIGSPYWIDYGLIDYDQNNTYQDEFQKSVSYSWQNEFRIALDINYPNIWYHKNNVIYNDDKNSDIFGAITLKIGNISDIACMVNFNEFLDLNFQIPANELSPIYLQSLGLPRPNKQAFAHPVIFCKDTLLISQGTLYPISTPMNMLRQSRSVFNLKKSLDFNFYLSLVNDFFINNITSIIKLYGRDSEELSYFCTKCFEYLLNLEVKKCGGVTWQINNRHLQIGFDIVPILDRLAYVNEMVEKTFYHRDTSTDWAKLVSVSNQKEFEEYEYKGQKLVRIIPSKDVILSSGEVCKAGEPVWVEVQGIQWYRTKNQNT